MLIIIFERGLSGASASIWHGGSSRQNFRKPRIPPRNSPVLRPEIVVPGKARSKRSHAAPCNWTSRLLALSPTPTAKAALKKESGDNAVVVHVGGDGRRCLHCATDKTP
ncbi:hypothetical protein U1Q18_030691 [Sarracenia purpurea var. burkii]